MSNNEKIYVNAVTRHIEKIIAVILKCYLGFSVGASYLMNWGKVEFLMYLGLL